MRKSAAITCVILTLASTFSVRAYAANASPSPDFVDPAPQTPPPTEEQRALQKSVDIAPEPPAPPAALRRLGYFHRYRSGVSLLGFGVADSRSLANRDGLLERASLYYLFADSNLNQWEIGADLQSDQSGALSFEARWILSRTRFRPFTKAGLGLRINPDDQFATILRLENYQLRGSAGFEANISAPLSLRTEVEATISGRSFQILAGAGLVWAW